MERLITRRDKPATTESLSSPWTIRAISRNRSCRTAESSSDAGGNRTGIEICKRLITAVENGLESLLAV